MGQGLPPAARMRQQPRSPQSSKPLRSLSQESLHLGHGVFMGRWHRHVVARTNVCHPGIESRTERPWSDSSSQPRRVPSSSHGRCSRQSCPCRRRSHSCKRRQSFLPGRVPQLATSRPTTSFGAPASRLPQNVVGPHATTPQQSRSSQSAKLSPSSLQPFRGRCDGVFRCHDIAGTRGHGIAGCASITVAAEGTGRASHPTTAVAVAVFAVD